MIRFVVVAGCLLFSKAASAHSAVPGIEGFSAGLLHPFQDLSNGLAVFAVGLLVGRQGGETANRSAAAFAVASIAGLASAFLPAPPFPPVPYLFAMALGAGALVALDRPLPSPVAVALGGVGGALAGVGLSPASGTWSAIAFTASGSFFGAAVLFYYAAIGAMWARFHPTRPWWAIGLRILGSWTAAVSALMLALALRA